MMTFKEYLIESTIMSTDALKQAMSDYDQRGIGKPNITKPSHKRVKQMDKRKARKAGTEEEEVRRGGKEDLPWFLKRQGEQPLEQDKPKRGRPKTPKMLKRQAW